jgi:DNA-binding SARP family transcriptional activator
VWVELLGPTTLRIDGVPRPIGGPRRRTVLALLALAGPTGLAAESLASAIFGDAIDARNRSTLHVHVCQLRAQLIPYENCVTRDGPTYRLDATIVDTDILTLERAVSAWRVGRPDARALLSAAIRTWRGELCADLPDLQALSAARTHYRELHLDALEVHFDSELESGADPDLPERIESALALAPLRERLWAQLMLALYALGRQTAALGAYQRARTVLADEAGVEPGAALRELELLILRQTGLERTAPTVGIAGNHTIVWLDATGVLQSVPLVPGREITVGRDARCTVRIDWDPAVSRHHAALTLANNRCVVRDLGSRNGTFVDGGSVTDTSVLPSRGTLRVGESVLFLRGRAGDGRPVDSHQITRHHTRPTQQRQRGSP